MKLKLILVLLLVLQCANAGELARITLDGGITLNVSKFISNRSLPHAFYDQAMSSIPLLYPDYMIYAKRRQGKLGTDQEIRAGNHQRCGGFRDGRLVV